MYLDSAATTKPRKEVIDAMIPYLTEKWHNPSSIYGNAVQVKKDIETARKTIADFVGAEPEEIYFTSGASESNNFAIQGFVNQKRKEGKKSCIITSCIEHNSIRSCIEGVRTNDLATAYVEVCQNGFIKMDGVIDALHCHYSAFDILTSIQYANNEIGTIQDIKQISDIVHKYKGVFHTDATQAFGKTPIDVKKMGIDMMSVSAHKICGPKGVGFLYIKDGINIQPLIYGSQERGMKGGTENVVGIIGFAKAVELLDVSKEIYEIKCHIRDNVINKLKKKFGCTLNGVDTWRLPDNINVTFPQNITGESLLYTLDLSDIQISVGSACNSKSVEPSHILKAIGLTDEEAARTIRVTLPDIFEYTTDEYGEMLNKFFIELDKAIKIIEGA